MAHRDAIVDGNGIKFFSDATGCLDFSCDELPKVFKVHVPGYKLSE